MKFPPPASVIHCRLCWTVTTAVFLGIVVIEAIILIPSYTNYERDRLEAIELAGLQAVRASLGAQSDGARTDALHTLLDRTLVRGLQVFHDDRVVVEIGESAPARLDPADSLRDKRRQNNPLRM